ncbi:MAG TPA: hypothetical protein VH352_05575, partial [Pseudonocardiaceae bacterium]|nr:hypothetical protein [Pseudonocardiaceae bacterium]
LVAATACAGQSTPAAPLDPAAVLPAIKSATQSATAVHVKGTIVDHGNTTSLDVQLNRDGSASGTVAESGTSLTMIVVRKVVYLKFTAALMKANGVDPAGPAGALLLNKWVSSESKVLSGTGLVAGVKPLVDYTTFTTTLLNNLGTATAKAGKADVVDGVPVTAYALTDGTTVDIAAASPHYMIRLAPPASQASGTADFTGWNMPVAIAPPPAAELYSGPGA